MNGLRNRIAFTGLLFFFSGVVCRAELTTGTASVGEASTILSFGFGMPIVNNKYTQLYQSGNVGRAINAGLMGQIGTSTVYWGLDFSLNFWSFNPGPLQPGTNLTRDAVGIQPLVTLVYRFASTGGVEWFPYFGFSAGPQLFIQHNRFTNAATLQTNSDSNTTLYLQVFARPGVEYHLADSVALTFEPKFGLLGTDFIFQPQIALALLL